MNGEAQKFESESVTADTALWAVFEPTITEALRRSKAVRSQSRSLTSLILSYLISGLMVTILS